MVNGKFRRLMSLISLSVSSLVSFKFVSIAPRVTTLKKEALLQSKRYFDKKKKGNEENSEHSCEDKLKFIHVSLPRSDQSNNEFNFPFKSAHSSARNNLCYKKGEQPKQERKDS